MSQMLININREILKLETMLQSGSHAPETPKVRLDTTISGNATGTVVELQASPETEDWVANNIQLIVFMPGVANKATEIEAEIKQNMSEIIQLLKKTNKGGESNEDEESDEKQFLGQTSDDFYSTFNEILDHNIHLSETFTVQGLQNDIDCMLVIHISSNSKDEGG
jgi:hypothetical protein